jgi:DNA-binding transcriptional MocR family regulator
VTLAEWRWAVLSPESGLAPTQRLVALVLANFMQPARPTCWPSIDTLCEATGLSRSTIKAATAVLDELGYISRTRGVGRGNSTKYEAVLEKGRPTGRFPGSEKGQLTREKGQNSPLKGPAHRPRSVRSTQRDAGAALNGAPPLDECAGCGERRELVDERFLYCASCDPKAASASG